MRASILYRIAAILLVLFAIGHLLGFRDSDPSWGIDPLRASMRTIRFDVQGFSRTYWDLFLAAGFSVGLLYLFLAVLAWQLSRLSGEVLAKMPLVVWTLAACFGVLTVLSLRYLFMLPIVFSALITILLTAAARLSTRRAIV